MTKKQQKKQQTPAINSLTNVSLHTFDLKLLEKYGKKELERMGYSGVLGRLIQTGAIKENKVNGID